MKVILLAALVIHFAGWQALLICFAVWGGLSAIAIMLEVVRMAAKALGVIEE